MYPTNFLRNIGLRGVRTEYVFIIDVDFIPNKDIYNHIKLYTQQGLPSTKQVNSFIQMTTIGLVHIFSSC